jgi:enediyne biosynthesis protein E4
MGVAAGDVDNDGCVDLYVTRYGRNSLLRNRCDGTFEDRTMASGTGHEGWSTSATFFDFDRDGWLDLYVTDYVTYRLNSHTDCVTPSGKPDYCSPSAFRPRPGQLFRNDRDGTFTNVTRASGIGTVFGPGLGAIAVDVNGDGWSDLYVANDGRDNQLWMNQRDGTFADTALIAGVAVNGAGRPEASMGVDAGDVDGDGDDDLFVTNLTAEGHTLYLNDGAGVFEDGATRAGIRAASLPYTGFGTTSSISTTTAGSTF